MLPCLPGFEVGQIHSTENHKGKLPDWGIEDTKFLVDLLIQNDDCPYIAMLVYQRVSMHGFVSIASIAM